MATILADGWVLDVTGITGTPHVTRPPGLTDHSDWAQRIQYIGAAGDTSDRIFIYDVMTAAGTFAPGDVVTVSAPVYGVVTGAQLAIDVYAYNAAAGFISSESSGSLTLTRARSVVSFTTAALPYAPAEPQAPAAR